MATVRTGTKGALLVVDVQVGVVRELWDAPRVVANVARSVERARAAGVPVIWVQHSDDDIPKDGADWPLVPELVPSEGEVRVDKHHNSSFEETSLEDALATLGVSHVVLAGAATSWCIRATAYGALDRGYDLTLVADAHSTESIPLQDGGVIEAEHIVRELNAVMTWVSYPGRTNTAALAEDVDFTAMAT